MKTITIRFYEELNDFLPKDRKKRSFQHHFKNNPSIKDIIESLGVPHCEVDLILANGQSIDFSCQPENDDIISVYPQFESFDISPLIRLREKPLRVTRFISDVNLGKLAKYLRLLGFDTLYNNNYKDNEITEIAAKEKRIILTRDTGLLKRKRVLRGYFVRSTNPKDQIKEIIHRFDLQNNICSFTRCLECNGLIMEVSKTDIYDKLQPNTKKYFSKFFQCGVCKKIYWQGSHYENMIKEIKTWLDYSGLNCG